ncbi:hypothetical protein AAFF_G00360410 [Aldrovandia affinis]|uniref:Uncharacterized protein n=1 Tax=Aldrovandia affinis TaxID=143900 RepID=A0AAD7WNF6_9TELE|nr:hypothetical protein AAFF_G00360410 [Aldrovandia affinis]
MTLYCLRSLQSAHHAPETCSALMRNVLQPRRALYSETLRNQLRAEDESRFNQCFARSPLGKFQSPIPSILSCVRSSTRRAISRPGAFASVNSALSRSAPMTVLRVGSFRVATGPRVHMLGRALTWRTTDKCLTCKLNKGAQARHAGYKHDEMNKRRSPPKLGGFLQSADS